MAAALCGAIGVLGAAFPRAWLSLFDSDPAMIDAGSRYLRSVGPLYGLFGLGMGLSLSRCRMLQEFRVIFTGDRVCLFAVSRSARIMLHPQCRVVNHQDVVRGMRDEVASFQMVPAVVVRMAPTWSNTPGKTRSANSRTCHDSTGGLKMTDRGK
jgi:hypothetical protein